jgi:catechol 2,3-dioxygenase-like lactoylglutathione lyase family enzyme
MGILQAAEPMVVICTRDRDRAEAFYRDTLGLTLASEDTMAAVFSVGGITLRLSTVEGFVPHEHTILGFRVTDVPGAVAALRQKGVAFNTYPAFRQDELGVLSIPGTAIKVAWLNDPDGNVLSVTNA